MPATERAFTDPLPQRLYLDTNIFLDYLIVSRPHHARVEAFILRLAHDRATTLYVSSLSWIEFAHAVIRQSFRDALPDEWRDRYQLTRWQTAAVRRNYLQAWLDLMERLLGQFAWDEVAVTSSVRSRALHHIGSYNLRPQDAVHLACAEEAGVLDLASFDAAFRRVDRLYLWNDHIHAPRAAGS